MKKVLVGALVVVFVLPWPRQHLPGGIEDHGKLW
jgi:hypothetical protein